MRIWRTILINASHTHKVNSEKRFKEEEKGNLVVSKLGEGEMTPIKMLQSFKEKSHKLLTFARTNKLCLMIPDFEGIKVEEIDSADILLERLRIKPQNPL